jgi:hypothetical protein
MIIISQSFSLANGMKFTLTFFDWDVLSVNEWSFIPNGLRCIVIGVNTIRSSCCRRSYSRRRR